MNPSPDLQEAIKDVVEAWDWWRVDPVDRCSSVVGDAIANLRAAVRAPAQEAPAPVAWRLTDGEGDYEYLTEEPSDQSRAWSRRYGREWEPLYASPVSSTPSEPAQAATKAAAYLRDEVRDDDSINTEVCDKGDPGAYPVYRSAAQTEPEPLRDALEFYADPTRYNGPNSRLEGVPDKYQPEGLYYRIDVTRDGGRIARRALAASSTLPLPAAPKPVSFLEAMNIVERGFDTWKDKPHNAKWYSRIDGTPIPNDLKVNIAEAICHSTVTSTHRGTDNG